MQYLDSVQAEQKHLESSKKKKPVYEHGQIMN